MPRSIGLIRDQSLALTVFYCIKAIPTGCAASASRTRRSPGRWSFSRTTSPRPRSLSAPPTKTDGRSELFYRWLKQHLRIERFFGTSETVVKSQVRIEVAVGVLVAIIHKRFDLESSLQSMLQILSVTPFEIGRMFQMLTNLAPAEGPSANPNQLIPI